VIVPDLRLRGQRRLNAFHDVPAHSRDLALVTSSVSRTCAVWVIRRACHQDLSNRFPDWVDRMVLFNSPLPYDRADGRDAPRPPAEASDYFVR
jgi:hypothetical protein